MELCLKETSTYNIHDLVLDCCMICDDKLKMGQIIGYLFGNADIRVSIVFWKQIHAS